MAALKSSKSLRPAVLKDYNMSNYQYSPLEISNLTPLGETVLVTEMNFERRVLNSGIILASDDGKSHGIRPRWGRVYAVGPDQQDVKAGDWICVAHGRWTRGLKIQESATGEIHTIRRVDPKDILLISESEECPSDETIGEGI